MRKYLWLLILLCPFLFAGSIQQRHMEIIGLYNAGGGASCTTANDSLIVDKMFTYDSNSGQEWLGTKFTVGSATTITEYIVNVCHKLSTGDVRVMIYTDSGDLPNTVISGTQISLNYTALSLCDPSPVNTTFTLASPYSSLSSGTYWVVIEGYNSEDIMVGRDESETGERRAYSADGSSWTAVANSSNLLEVWGCQ